MSNLDEEKLAWILRAFGVFAGAAGLLFITLLFAMGNIAPAQRWDVFFVSFKDDSGRGMVVSRANDMQLAPGNTASAIAKRLIARYVIAREGFETSAGTDVFLMSSPAEREELRAIRRPLSKAVAVSVDPDEVIYHGRKDEWHVVARVTTSNRDGTARESKKKTIEIRAAFAGDSFERSKADKWRNPLGFEVLGYREVEVEDIR